MLENITEVIGFDLGHRETMESLKRGRAMEEIKSARNKEMESTTVGWDPAFIDALSEVPTSGVKDNCQNQSSRRVTMFESITEVIGFDLGHGETALTCLRLDDLDKHSEPVPVEIYKKKNHITAIGYHPKKGTLIGESALRTPGITESYITFKRRPNSDPIYQRIMHDFIKTVYVHLVEQGKVEGDTSRFIVGCPSEWTQDETVVPSYEQIFSQADIPDVTVIAESRAALVQAVESGMLRIAELIKGLVLVIDVGSSTTDFTLVDLKDKKSIPFDIGRDLGAALIDKEIAKWTLKKHPNQDELEKIFEEHPHIRNACELICRKAKQEYFSDPERYQEAGDYAPGGGENIQGRYLFMPEIDGAVMGEILNTHIVKIDGELKTWPDAFENELEKLRQQLESSKDLSPEVILLTGGASRMNFVPEICKKVFPQSSVKSDNAPEFCIAKGLARWGRVEINTSQFFKDIEQFCSETIRPKVEGRIDSLYESIAGIIADKVIRIIKRQFDRWKDRTYYTINSMQHHIDREIENLMQEKTLSELFRDQIRPILTNIGSELRDDIKGLENKYGIPIGTLGASFDLSTPGINRFSLGSQSKIDATDGMAEGLGTIVGWISGILATVVAYVVAPVVLAIVVVIISLISTTLASLIFAILISNPGGLLILAGIGLVGLVAGEKAKEAVESNMPSWDLPLWVRNLVDKSSVYSSIDKQHSVIVNEVTSKLKEDDNIRQQLTDKITSVFEKSLVEKAEDARLLIS